MNSTARSSDSWRNWPIAAKQRLLTRLEETAERRAVDEQQAQRLAAARARRIERQHRWTSPGALAHDLDPTTRSTAALDLIDAELVQLANGATDRLMLFMPPQEGKSQRTSRWFPLWLLADDPTLRIAVVSYADQLAEKWGRQIRRDIRSFPSLEIELMPDSQAAGRWETTAGGGLICVGIAGGITGQPVDVLIIDDPVRGRAEAESITYRDAAWEWWESNGSTRLSSRGRVVLMMTRWHADDLAGRMLEREPGRWQVVSIPAIAEDDDDPLGRAPGDELTSVQGRAPGYFTNLREVRSPYVWRSVYQQRPVAAEGAIFARGGWRYWTSGDSGRTLVLADDGAGRRDTVLLADCTRFLTIDLATSTKTSADWTVASAWAITPGGDLLLLDRRRERVPETDHAAFVAPLRQRWLSRYDVTRIESRMFGTTLVYALGRAGVPVAELDADVDKLTRALPYAGLVRQHRVWLPQDASWLDEWIDEHAEFPSGRHDDQVDTGAYAARVLLTEHVAPLTFDQEQQMRAAARAADGEFVDLMTARF